MLAGVVTLSRARRLPGERPRPPHASACALSSRPFPAGLPDAHARSLGSPCQLCIGPAQAGDVTFPRFFLRLYVIAAERRACHLGRGDVSPHPFPRRLCTDHAPFGTHGHAGTSPLPLGLLNFAYRELEGGRPREKSS